MKTVLWGVNDVAQFIKFDGIYMDICHVYERGNMTIAQYIYDRVIDVYFQEKC
ncbi:hypothetical protein [Butyrivibrio sp. NC3005]|uniref:hypothetical protein n=1 Tax=Butyrivibrio sp. NC3005 TaxID=1280685 RepID=UPI000426DA73|nr:hypothetical protein [Butyrivibrio sp. NC3005]